MPVWSLLNNDGYYSFESHFRFHVRVPFISSSILVSYVILWCIVVLLNFVCRSPSISPAFQYSFPICIQCTYFVASHLASHVILWRVIVVWIHDHPWRAVSSITASLSSNCSVRHSMTYCRGVALLSPLGSHCNVPIYTLISRPVAYYSYTISGSPLASCFNVLSSKQ